MNKFIVSAILLLLLSMNSGFAQNKFESALRIHLEAINSRNFSAFEQTITKDSALTLILPNGKLTTTRKEYLELMKEWFSEPSWEMKHTLISKEETKDMGYALLLVNYHDITSDNKPYHLNYYLLLIFKRVYGKWYLVHDQNTKLEN